MKTILWGLFLLWNFDAVASNVTIDFKNSYNGYATVGGTVSADSGAGPFIVTVENAGLKYSTLSDASGKYAVVFRHASVKFDVSAVPLNRPDQQVAEISSTLQ